MSLGQNFFKYWQNSTEIQPLGEEGEDRTLSLSCWNLITIIVEFLLCSRSYRSLLLSALVCSDVTATTPLTTCNCKYSAQELGHRRTELSNSTAAAITQHRNNEIEVYCGLRHVILNWSIIPQQPPKLPMSNPPHFIRPFSRCPLILSMEPVIVFISSPPPHSSWQTTNWTTAEVSEEVE